MIPDARDAVRDRHARKTDTERERALSDVCNAVAYLYRNRVLLIGNGTLGDFPQQKLRFRSVGVRYFGRFYGAFA